MSLVATWRSHRESPRTRSSLGARDMAVRAMVTPHPGCHPFRLWITWPKLLLLWRHTDILDSDCVLLWGGGVLEPPGRQVGWGSWVPEADVPLHSHRALALSQSGAELGVTPDPLSPTPDSALSHPRLSWRLRERHTLGTFHYSALDPSSHFHKKLLPLDGERARIFPKDVCVYCWEQQAFR